MPRARSRQTQQTCETTTPAAPAAPRGLAALRLRSATAAPKSKASSVPEVSAPNEIHDAIRKWTKAYKTYKDAEGALAEASGRIQPVGDRIRTEHCRAARELIASIRLKAPAVPARTENGQVVEEEIPETSVRFERQAASCKIQAQEKLKDGSIRDNESLISASIGNPETEARLFTRKTTYRLDEAALTALPNYEEIAQRLLEALGDHADLLVNETVLIPTEQYYKARVGLVNAEEEAITQRLERDQLVVLKSPSIKL